MYGIQVVLLRNSWLNCKMRLANTNMITRYVADTNSVISFFQEFFSDAPNFDGAPSLWREATKIIEQAVFSKTTKIRLSIPSVVFLEIFEKWLRTEEFQRKFYYEVFVRLEESEHVDIRSIDQELLENLMRIGGCLSAHDLNDKLIVAVAVMLECTLITTDSKIEEFAESEPTVLQTLS